MPSKHSEPPSQQNDPPKHAGGRPLAYKTVGELDLAIQLYFDKQDPHVETHMVATGVSANGTTMFDTRDVLTDQKPYTMSGLARALELDRKSLLNYKNRDQFFLSIQAAIDRCQEYAESQLFGPYANGAKFNLTNNYTGEYQPWADRQSRELTGKDGGPIETKAVEIMDVADDEDKPETSTDS